MSASNIGWSEEVGVRPYRVVVEERLDRGGRIYLRYRAGGNWKREATEITVRNVRGGLVRGRQRDALRAGKVLADQLAQGTARASKNRPLTITQGLLRAIDPKQGKYPSDTMHRREVRRELERAAVIWSDRTWNSIRPGDIRELYRTRAEQLKRAGHVGRRGAEVTVARVLAVAEWLRAEGLIEAGACHAPKEWQKKLGAEVTEEAPNRPRYTRDELRAILRASRQVDPRAFLMFNVGLGRRMGQFARVARSKLDTDRGLLRVPGRGNKRGGLVALTPDERQLVQWALNGYLAPLEALLAGGEVADYPLFPSGQLTGGRTDPGGGVCRAEQAHAAPVGGSAIRQWWRRAEELAGVPHVAGRGTYGGKRLSVDEGKRLRLSRDELASLGGWTGPQMADLVYADEEIEDVAVGASRARDEIRGKVLDTPDTYPVGKQGSEPDTVTTGKGR